MSACPTCGQHPRTGNEVPFKPCYSTVEIAKWMGKSGNHIQKQCASGKIPSDRTGVQSGDYQIPVSFVWETMGLTQDERLELASRLMNQLNGVAA